MLRFLNFALHYQLISQRNQTLEFSSYLLFKTQPETRSVKPGTFSSSSLELSDTQVYEP